jgi:hypothetical protein
MTDAELRKSWKVTEVLLERARRALPAPPAANEEEHRMLLARYHEYLQHNELELALDALEELGKLVACRGGFWRDLERAAENMELTDRLPALRKKFEEAPVQSDAPPKARSR